MQTRRMTHEEIDHTLCLFAAMNTLHKILGKDRMESRIRFIPNGWRDANMVYKRLKWLCDQLMETIPDEKRQALEAQMGAMKYKVYTHPDAVPPKDHFMIRNDNYETLAIAAHEQCMLCDHSERCKSCQLGKALDAHLPFTRTKSWAYIDLADILRGDSNDY